MADIDHSLEMSWSACRFIVEYNNQLPKISLLDFYHYLLLDKGLGLFGR
jgi:hypothetical protein